jgi:hypothetical protein
MSHRAAGGGAIAALLVAVLSMSALAHGTETVMLSVRLAVTGTRPPDSTLFVVVRDATIGGPPIGWRLSDEDGDGVYAVDARAFEPDQVLAVRIESGVGAVDNPIYGGELELPGPPVRLLHDFGAITLHRDTTLSAAITFGDGGSPPSSPDGGRVTPGLSVAGIAAGVLVLVATTYLMQRRARPPTGRGRPVGIRATPRPRPQAREAGVSDPRGPVRKESR